jgi:acyl-CoA thioesterase
VRGEWAVEPDIPPPADCPPRVLPERMRGTILDRLQMRVASWPTSEIGVSPDGRTALWVQLPDGLRTSAAALAVVGDHVPYGIRMALGGDNSGNSLDNTLRMVSRTPTEWVLADVRVQAVRDGFGHGIVHLWSEEGRLLATASQSTIIRPHGDRDTDDA